MFFFLSFCLLCLFQDFLDGTAQSRHEQFSLFFCQLSFLLFLSNFFFFFSGVVFVENAIAQGGRELSPYEALFMLSFQIDEEKEVFKFVPHRLFHRYARKSNQEVRILSFFFFFCFYRTKSNRLFHEQRKKKIITITKNRSAFEKNRFGAGSSIVYLFFFH